MEVVADDVQCKGQIILVCRKKDYIKPSTLTRGFIASPVFKPLNTV